MNQAAKTTTRDFAEGTRIIFGDFPDQFRDHLSTQGYAPATIDEYVRVIDGLAGLMEAEGLALSDLDEALANDLAARACRAERCRTHAAFIGRRFARFLNAHGVGKPTTPTTPVATARAVLRADYEHYLRHQRGLSERTILACWRHAVYFLDFRFGGATEDLSLIRTTDIAAFLEHLTVRETPYRCKSVSSRLRNFFRYLFQAGKTATNLATGIPSVAQRYGARLPRHLAPDQVNALLEAIRSNTPTGRRDYAMILLMARLGLRAPEVVAMRIDDIDWRAGELIVRGKGDAHDRMPLPPDVGEALVAYITHDRVSPSRTLFVTMRAPHTPFKNGQILNNILRDAFARTGLKPPSPYVGSHILRHSLAVTLVRDGASLEEVGNMLRHRSRESTMIYARLDIEGLRSLALPWPVEGGVQ